MAEPVSMLKSKNLYYKYEIACAQCLALKFIRKCSYPKYVAL